MACSFRSVRHAHAHTTSRVHTHVAAAANNLMEDVGEMRGEAASVAAWLRQVGMPRGGGGDGVYVCVCVCVCVCVHP